MLLQIKSLTKSFDGKIVIDDTSITLSAGIYALTGPSGCGKTTFARILAGLETPDSGEITPGSYTTSFMFQEPRLFPWIDVLSNIVKVTGCSVKRATELLCALELSNDTDKLPSELSGGMQKRVAVARTLALSDADLYVFDEPLSGLDDSRKRTVCQLIKESIPKDSICLIISHEMSEITEITDKILRFEKGKIIS